MGDMADDYAHQQLSESLPYSEWNPRGYKTKGEIMEEKSNKLAKVDPQAEMAVSQNSLLNLNLQQVQSLAKVFAASGMFTDIAKDSAKAFVKILAGQEMGIPPFQALSDIHIIQGKATAGGNIHAAKIKQSLKYDYRVKNWTAKGCAIEFYEKQGGKPVLLGTSQFDENDAKQAGLLSNPSWAKYPRNMYFNRAITNGVRTFCPDALGGMTAYTPDELTGGKDYIEVEETSMPVREVHHAPEAKAAAEPVDKHLLEEDQDPDMPPNWLQDEVSEITDKELNEPLSLPDLEDSKARSKK